MQESNIFFLILFAATLHAGWNLIIKSLKNSLTAIGVKLLLQSIVFIPFIFFVPLPTGITWLFIIVSVLLHNYYFITLGISYNKGDLSYVYPISRGCSPIFITILAFLFLHDRISITGIVGILIVSFGLLLLTFKDIKNKINLDVLKLALIISFTISLYTLCDGAGVRSVDNSFSYIVWIFFLDGWLIFAYVYYKNKKDLFSIQLKQLGLIVLASMMSITAYSIIIWSMKYTKIGYVSSIREASIIIATLFGLIFLKEKMVKVRIISAFIFCSGIIIIYNS